MQIKSVLVVCVGNICRSPLGERMLKAELDKRGLDVAVSSAGIHAMVGHAADDDAASVAQSHGVALDGHAARQFTEELGSQHDMILVMEPGHKSEVARLAPSQTGKTFLYDQWSGAKGIADPYRRSLDFHEAVFEQVQAASLAWADKLGKSARR